MTVIAGAHVGRAAASGQISIDQTIYKDGHGTVTTSLFNTSSQGEVLLAFAASDGPLSGGQTVGVSGAGLTWSLVNRTNTQAGTAEIWSAYASAQLSGATVTSTQGKGAYDQSLTVLALRGASGVGATAGASAASGAPAVTVTTSRAGSWVFAVGNDWDNAIARTIGTNQVMEHQWVNTGMGDTYWVQGVNGQTASAGTPVQLSDTAPTIDRWDYAAAEVLATAVPTVPGAPTGVSATAGNGSAIVSWAAPANGGSPITSYTVTPYVGTTAQPVTTVTGSPPATSATIGGLSIGTTYTLTVTATNAVGTGAPSAASNAVTPTGPTVPGAPTGVAASAGNASATVSWTSPADGGSPITKYTVTPFVGTTAQASTDVTGSPPATSATIGGLSTGTTYTLTVTATNAIGTGAASAASNAVTPAAPPGAPTGVSANAGNGSATVSWTAPANGGSPITSYTVTPYVGTTAQPATTVTGSLAFDDEFNGAVLDSNAWIAMNRPGDASNNELECYIPGNAAVSNGSLVLTSKVDSSCPGYNYSSAMVQWSSYHFLYGTVEIRAKLAGGKGTWPTIWMLGANCQQTNVTTPDNVPPCNWPAPGSDEIDIAEILGGNMSSVNQQIHSTLGNPGCTASSTDMSQNWHTYDLVWQPASVTWQIDGVTTCVIAQAVPSNPMFLLLDTAVGGFGGGTVDNLTLPQTHSIDYVRIYQTSPPAISATIGGLSNGTSYAFTVAATNAVGTSAPSAASNAVTPTGPPGAPTGVSAAAGNGSATVSWTGPAGGGSPITKYRVTPYLGTTAQPSTDVPGSPPATSATIGGLTNGVTYTFTVTASNAQGTGAASAASNAVAPTGPPAAPTGVSAVAGNGSATVSWTAPANGGSPITKYTVTPYMGTTAQPSTDVTGSPPATSATIGGLSNGTAYAFTVTATNAVGPGPPSAASNAVTPTGPTVPAAPTGVSAIAGNGSATVNWTAPANGGSPITKYTVTPYIGTTAQPTAVITGSPPATSATVTGLSNNVTYTFTVVATNAVGSGPVSAASNPVTPVAFNQISIDQTVYRDAHGTVTTSPFNTLGAGELLVALVASDGPLSGGQTVTVSGAGLSWKLVKRTNSQAGTAEIWSATVSGQLSGAAVTSTQAKTGYDQSLTVVAFKGATGIGQAAGTSAASGAPSVTLTTSRAGSVVYGVGNDWDNPIGRTLGGNQVMVHQWVNTGAGDTYWVQSTSGQTSAAGTPVQLNDTAPTTDRWDYAAVEVLAS